MDSFWTTILLSIQNRNSTVVILRLKLRIMKKQKMKDNVSILTPAKLAYSKERKAAHIRAKWLRPRTMIPEIACQLKVPSSLR